MWLPGPYTWMVAEWLVRQGVPVLRRRLVRTTALDVLFEGEATLEQGGEPVRGTLALTPDALLFTPHRARRDVLSLPLAGIEDVAAGRSRLFGLIPASPNAIKVRSSRGIFRFRLEDGDRETWLRRLAEARAEAALPPLP